MPSTPRRPLLPPLREGSTPAGEDGDARRVEARAPGRHAEARATQLTKGLTSTDAIDSIHSGVRLKTRRVTNWKNAAMALRRAAASFVETEMS